jgi:hypothetical protein
MAIVTWYYGVYSAASAMTAAMDGSFQDNHSDTARKWQERFPANKLAMDPFADSLSNLLATTVEAELQLMRGMVLPSFTKPRAIVERRTIETRFFWPTVIQ